MRKLAAIVCAGMAAAGSGCAQAATPQVSPEQVVAAVRDCAEATGPGGTDEAVLQALGYERGTASADGQAIELDFTALAKEGGGPLILTGKSGEGNRACAITGALAPSSGFEEFLRVLRENFSEAGSDDGNHYFRVGSDIALATRTRGGNGSFRVAVIEPGDN